MATFLSAQREWATFTIFLKRTRFLPLPQSISTSWVRRVSVKLTYGFCSCKITEMTPSMVVFGLASNQSRVRMLEIK